MRPRSGLDRVVSDWVLAHGETRQLIADTITLITARHAQVVGVGCSAGRHRSVAVAEELAAQFIDQGRSVHVEHRDLTLKRAKAERSTTEKGLGWRHQKDRDRLLRAHIDATLCWWCGKPMYRDRTRNWDYDPASTDRASGSLAADHSHARAHGGTKADRLLHGQCNKMRGEGARDHLRPALGGQGAESVVAPSRPAAFPWPDLR